MNKAPIEDTAIFLTFIGTLPLATHCFICLEQTNVTGL
jgi:hypothetical protein